MTEKLAINILEHFYLSFRTFYGRFLSYSPSLPQLEKILNSFTYSYHEINKLEETKRLDISSYMFENIRALPLDVNSSLKFAYFQNVMKNYDENVEELMVFSNGLLAYSSLPKQYTAFFSEYFFGTGEPYRYDGNIVLKKMKVLDNIDQMTHNDTYGTIYNSYGFGFGTGGGGAGSVFDPTRSSLSVTPSKKNPSESSSSLDLLGLEANPVL